MSIFGSEPLQSFRLQTTPSKIPFVPLANPFSVAILSDRTQGEPLTKYFLSTLYLPESVASSTSKGLYKMLRPRPPDLTGHAQVNIGSLNFSPKSLL